MEFLRHVPDCFHLANVKLFYPTIEGTRLPAKLQCNWCFSTVVNTDKQKKNPVQITELLSVISLMLIPNLPEL